MSLPTVFISYDHDDESVREKVLDMAGRLTADGVFVWLDAYETEPREGWPRWSAAKILEADHVLVVCTAGMNLVWEQFLTRRNRTRRNRANLLWQHRLAVQRLFDSDDSSRVIPVLLARQDQHLVPSVLRSCATYAIDEDDSYEALYRRLTAQPIMVRPNLGSPSPVLAATPGISTSVERMPETGRWLFGRNKEIRKLTNAWMSPATHVMCIVAWAGVGKSSLVNHWLARMALANYRGAERIYAWSFYKQGATDEVVSADLFIQSALRWFGDPDPSHGVAADRGERLAHLIQGRKTLLVLDGLEPLQHPPGAQEGRLRDEGLRALLRSLAAQNPGLCVITTRVPVAELVDYEPHPVRRVELTNLQPEDGARVLTSFGVQGSTAELEQASIDFGGHALALSLLGSYLADVFGGNVRKRDQVATLQSDARYGGHARRVMASYAQWFGEGPEIQVLRLLGLFDRPADPSAVSALRRKPAMAGLTELLVDLSEQEWRRLVSILRRARLLSDADPGFAGSIDAHPLIREHFGNELRAKFPASWTAGNNRLFEYSKEAAVEFPQTVEQMETLFLAVIYGCRASRPADALAQVYLPRVMRGDAYFAADQLGAKGALLSVISQFFEQGEWGSLADGLDADGELRILMDAGRYLTEVRGYGAPEVGRCYDAALQRCGSPSLNRQRFEVMEGLCRFHRMGGRLNESGTMARNLLDESAALGPEFTPAAQRALATNFFYTGEFSDSFHHARLGAVEYEHQDTALIMARMDVNEPAISCLGYQGLASWFLGQQDTAVSLVDEATRRARALGHSHTIAICLLMQAMVAQFRREEDRTLGFADELVELCSRKGFQLWRLAGEILRGWATVTSTSTLPSNVLAEMERSIAAWVETGAALFLPYWWGLYADRLLAARNLPQAMEALRRAAIISEKNGERWWSSELLRLKGEAILSDRRRWTEEGENQLRSAVALSRKQGAVSLELRSRLTLVQHLESSENGLEEIGGLVGVLRELREGQATVDVVSGRAFLASRGIEVLPSA